MTILSKSSLFEMRRDLACLDDGTKEFKEMYDHFSWFFQKYIDFVGRKKIEEKRIVEKLT